MSDNNSPRKPFKDKQAPKGPPAALFIWLLILITFVGIIIFKFNPSLMGVQEWNQTKFEAALNSGYIATADITGLQAGGTIRCKGSEQREKRGNSDGCILHTRHGK